LDVPGPCVRESVGAVLHNGGRETA
jgi:hypothetical protein